ncbi:MAG: lectin like domain-containing protein [Sulfurovaceae bacterium]|nr:lectin like domain-containing protein [Sulfurovaceae bacterium]MDD5548079.1 lectin like domain-containing protein [Sulfurovaceae bacterium]
MNDSILNIGPMKDWVTPSINTYKRLDALLTKSNDFPSQFDLRKLGRITPARTGSGCASCWSVAATGALESALLPEGTLKTFSEDHMQMSMSVCGGGGHWILAAGYYASWSGPVKYTDFDYQINNIGQNIPLQKHIQKIIFIPTRKDSLDNDLIKFHLIHYGGVYASVSYRGITNPSENTYYWPEEGSVHAVVIVGWDDTFDKNKFTYTYNSDTGPKTLTPPGNGAFIVKNNGGPDFGNEGYYYISYYDGTIGYSGLAIYLPEPINNFKKVYQHEKRGMVNSVYGAAESMFGANVFTATQSETLSAIGFFTNSVECEYTVSIYLNPHSGPINTSGAIQTFTSYVPDAGYHTLHLPKTITLTSGQKFSVVLSGKTKENWFVPLCCDYIFSTATNNTFSVGQSYICTNGINWIDMATMTPENLENGKNGNLCIKAYTTSKKPYYMVSSFIYYLQFWLTFMKLKVTATTPAQGENVPHPSLSTLTVTFNKDIKKGEAFYAIRLFSDIEVKSVFCTIEGNKITIISATPLATEILGGINWTAVIPKNAVTDLYNNGLSNEYSWTFSTIGVN